MPISTIEIRGLLHHVGARHIVTALFQDLDERFGAFVPRDVVLIAQACMRIVFLHPVDKFAHVRIASASGSQPAF